jgi:hypothetical protein
MKPANPTRQESASGSGQMSVYRRCGDYKHLCPLKYRVQSNSDWAIRSRKQKIPLGAYVAELSMSVHAMVAASPAVGAGQFRASDFLAILIVYPNAGYGKAILVDTRHTCCGAGWRGMLVDSQVAC